MTEMRSLQQATDVPAEVPDEVASSGLSGDPNELVVVRNDSLDGATATVARSALRQLTSSGWVLVSETGVAVGAGSVPRRVADGNDSAGDPSELVAIRNDELKATATVPRSSLAQHRLNGWYVDGELPAADAAQPIVRDGEFDPRAHGVKEVQDHLKTADDAERARVIAVEQANQKRKTIVGWEPPADSTGKDEG